MGKNKKSKSSVPDEVHLLLPQHAERPHPATTPIVDTHTHLLSTYSFYRSKYKRARYTTVYDFVRELYKDHGVDAIVDVYCEAPEHKTWKEVADSALTEEDRREKWGGLEYWFVMGASYPIIWRSCLTSQLHVSRQQVSTRKTYVLNHNLCDSHLSPDMKPRTIPMK